MSALSFHGSAMVDHWENSTLMAYISPFSGESASFLKTSKHRRFC